MLVKAIKDTVWGTAQIKTGRYYVVYAIEHIQGGTKYYTYSLCIKYEDEEYNPLPFDSEAFEIVADKTSEGWVTHDVENALGTVRYTSFPEWFDNNFYIRAHDWNLDGDDYKIVNKYKQEYEELYKEYIPLNEQIIKDQLSQIKIPDWIKSLPDEEERKGLIRQAQFEAQFYNGQLDRPREMTFLLFGFSAGPDLDAAVQKVREAGWEAATHPQVPDSPDKLTLAATKMNYAITEDAYKHDKQFFQQLADSYNVKYGDWLSPARA